MRYVLRYNQQELELAVGEFLIGRASSCQLSLDDPLVSRNHASLTVTEEGVTIEDLGSRNGVKVNGERLTTSRRLMNGDVIVIGSQELKFTAKRDVPTDTLVQAPTQRSASFGLMGVLADKALALGRGEEAERLLGPLLEQPTLSSCVSRVTTR
jgi:pSer/pThr/pTyr-binding forkhead associated (FHA) protein